MRPDTSDFATTGVGHSSRLETGIQPDLRQTIPQEAAGSLGSLIKIPIASKDSLIYVSTEDSQGRAGIGKEGTAG
jgi:hypothetical protein